MVTVSASNTSYAYLKGNQRAWCEYVTCEKADECEMHKKGLCVCFRYILGRNLTCPNGTWHRLTGPTKRAKSLYDFGKKVENEYKKTAKEYDKKPCVVPGYIYINLPHLTGCLYDFEGVINDHFFPIEDFDENLVDRLVRFMPTSWAGGAIATYREKYIPLFLQHIKELFPDVYEAWKCKYPESAKDYESLSPVGRNAYISTLPDGCIIRTDNGNFEKRGNYLYGTAIDIWLIPFMRRERTEIRIEITDGMTTQIKKDTAVDENTRYAD